MSPEATSWICGAPVLAADSTVARARLEPLVRASSREAVADPATTFVVARWSRERSRRAAHRARRPLGLGEALSSRSGGCRTAEDAR